MSKLYYDDPLKAAWMAREFGVKFTWPEYYEGCVWSAETIGTDRVEIFASHILELNKMNSAPSKYYVHPDSEHIFEPREGDLYEWTDSFGDNYGYTHHSGEELGDGESIIKRDNKAFFTPKREVSDE